MLTKNKKLIKNIKVSNSEFKNFNNNDFRMIHAYCRFMDYSHLLFLDGMNKNIIELKNNKNCGNLNQSEIDSLVNYFHGEIEVLLKRVDSIKKHLESIEDGLQ